MKHGYIHYKIETMICKCSLTVRTYECDSNGHVNNANYLNYIEYARYEYLKAIDFDYRELLKDGYGIYVARIEINYKKSAYIGDELFIKTWPVKKGAVSGTLLQEIWRGEELVADAKVTWAFVDSKGMPTKIPPRWDKPGLKPEK